MLLQRTLRPLRLVLSAASFLLCALPAAAQAPATPLRVFLDCDRCDFDYLRTEITFIDYVRDRKQAEVHVLVTTQSTGSSGSEWTVKFIGLERFAGVEQTLTFTTAQTATQDDERRAVAKSFTLGLVRYVAETPLADRLTIEFEKPDERRRRDVSESGSGDTRRAGDRVRRFPLRRVDAAPVDVPVHDWRGPLPL